MTNKMDCDNGITNGEEDNAEKKKMRKKMVTKKKRQKEREKKIRDFQKPKSIDRSCRLRSASAIVRSSSSRRQVRETRPLFLAYVARERA